MSLFAWCETHQHALCRGAYRRVVVDDKNRVTEGETRTCGCDCHGGET